MAQGWKKAFERLFWKNRPSTDTPLNATDMNHIESGIDALDDRIVQLDVLKADAQVVNGMVSDVSLNESNGVITITYKNGSHVDYDTNIEKIAVNFSYDYVNQRLVLTLSDGSKQYVDMSALITQYEFKDSTTIAFSVDSTGKVSASVKNGSITEAMLETGYLANIKVEVAKAEAAATQAQSSEASSDYNAKLSRSYAIGGSGIREGEDADNAMYYYEQAKKTDIGQISSDVAELNSNLDALEFGEVAGVKNLFEDEIKWMENITVTRGTKSVSDGKITLTATSADCYTDHDGASWKNNGIKIIPCKPNTTYTLSWKYEGDSQGDIYIFENGSTNNMSYAKNYAGKLLITTSADAEYLTFRVGVFALGASITYWNFQLEEGETATEYKPYIPSVKMIAEEVNQQKNDLIWKKISEGTSGNYPLDAPYKEIMVITQYTNDYTRLFSQIYPYELVKTALAVPILGTNDTTFFNGNGAWSSNYNTKVYAR